MNRSYLDRDAMVVPGDDDGGKNFKIPPRLRRLAGYGSLAVLGGALLTTIIGIATAAYKVPIDSQAVINRFGKYVRTTYPGLHLKWPFGIEKHETVATDKIHTFAKGFRTKEAGVRTQYIGVDNLNEIDASDLKKIIEEAKKAGYTSQKPSLEGQVEEIFQGEYGMLTGDLNVADVEYIVQYKVRDPVKYVFNIADPKKNIEDLAEVSIRHVVGDRSVDGLITTEGEEIQIESKEILQGKLDELDSGMFVVDVKLQGVNPPRAVRASYDEVEKAKQQKRTTINQAWELYNKTIPEERIDEIVVETKPDLHPCDHFLLSVLYPL
jgi:membrane protease subunit HflK